MNQKLSGRIYGGTELKLDHVEFTPPLAPPAPGFAVLSHAENFAVPAFGTADTPPIAFGAGSEVQMVVTVLDLDPGSLAAEQTTNPGGSTEVTWCQSRDGGGNLFYRFNNSAGSNRHVNYRLIQWGP